MSFLEIERVNKRFDKQIALKEVDLTIEQGELVCILGPSGCGKTTLLRIIAGLETPDAGKIIINGRDCTTLPPSKRNFGVVFQSYALFPNMTVEQNILFGLSEHKEMNKEAKRFRVREVLNMVDLADHRTKYPSQLSGGQQQRTALARAIAPNPEYLLLDEPLSALDAKVRVKLRAEICRIQRTLGITTIMVTHDQEEALTMADKIVVMNNAVVEQTGTPHEIYHRPSSPFVASFIGTMNFYERESAILGVRPENVIIQRELFREDDTHWIGTVTEVEFRGSQTRVYGKLREGREICADISSEQADALGIRKEDKCCFHVPHERFVRYPA